MSRRIAIVMAAGKGTRMNSELPKVLVPVARRPMVEYVIDALRLAEVDRIIVVVGYQAEKVRAQLASHEEVCFVEQTEQLGTGHAVMMCREELAGHEGAVLVVAGDSPLMQSDSMRSLFEEFERSRPACILGTGYRDDPAGFGRVVRDADGQFVSIIEEKDATDVQRAITEVNLSCYLFGVPDLLDALEQLDNANAQGEYYLTDCPGILLRRGRDVRALDVLKPCEALSINTVSDLAVVEAEMLKKEQGSVER